MRLDTSQVISQGRPEFLGMWYTGGFYIEYTVFGSQIFPNFGISHEYILLTPVISATSLTCSPT